MNMDRRDHEEKPPLGEAAFAAAKDQEPQPD
jgi:hypothetical protein